MFKSPSLKTMQFDNRPIGVFDSGVGGLSIAKCIEEQLPNEQLIYIADSKFAPYGDKSETFIVDRVNQIALWLIEQDAKAIVLACNTATVNAVDQLRSKISIPVIGVEPAIKPAASTSQSKKIALLVTQATSVNKRFLSLINQYKRDAQVYIQPCPGLVELVETAQHNSHLSQELLKQYLEPLINKGVDTIVLGCTHYPFLTESIRKIIPNNVELMETALPVTQQLSRQLNKFHLLAEKHQKPAHKFFSSTLNIEQTQAFSTIFGSEINLLSFNF